MYFFQICYSCMGSELQKVLFILSSWWFLFRCWGWGHETWNSPDRDKATSADKPWALKPIYKKIFSPSFTFRTKESVFCFRESDSQIYCRSKFIRLVFCLNCFRILAQLNKSRWTWFRESAMQKHVSVDNWVENVNWPPLRV